MLFGDLPSIEANTCDASISVDSYISAPAVRIGY